MKVNRTIDKKLRDQLDRWKTETGKTGEGEETATTEDTQTFEKAIAEREFELLDMEIQDLVEEVTRQGEKLKENQTPKTARRYKQVMASFLKKALEMSREVEVRKGKRSLSLEDLQKNEEKQHHIVKTIDEKMDKLTKAVVNRQEENIDLANHIDEIKGLVVDLVATVKEPLE